MPSIARTATAVMLGVAWALGAQAQDVVKIGQIEAQTGPNAIYGWMGSQGVPMAVDEINKRGGVTVADPPNNGVGRNVRSMVVQDPDGNRLKFMTLKES